MVYLGQASIRKTTLSEVRIYRGVLLGEGPRDTLIHQPGDKFQVQATTISKTLISQALGLAKIQEKEWGQGTEVLVQEHIRFR